MLGLVIGLCCGVIQFFLLRRFVRSVTSGGKPAVGLGILQLLLPAALLLGCAFFMPANLIWAATGIVIPVIGGSLIQLFLPGSRKKDPEPPKT
jgi:hypothetical protein